MWWAVIISAYSGFSYQQLAGQVLGLLSSKSHWAGPLTLGAFLLGGGWGFWEKASDSSFNIRKVFWKAWLVEITLLPFYWSFHVLYRKWFWVPQSWLGDFWFFCALIPVVFCGKFHSQLLKALGSLEIHPRKVLILHHGAALGVFFRRHLGSLEPWSLALETSGIHLFSAFLLKIPLYPPFLALFLLAPYPWPLWHARLFYEGLGYSVEKIFRKTSHYQTIDWVQNHGDWSLFLDFHHQASKNSWDSYHEAFWQSVTPRLMTAKKLLVIGGGDGLLVHKLLQLTSASIHIVEIDKEMIQLAQSSLLSPINHKALNHAKVRITVGDAWHWLRTFPSQLELYDGAFLDIPYPYSPDSARLYSQETFRLLALRVASKGFWVMDAPPPPWNLHIPQSGWSTPQNYRHACHNFLVSYRLKEKPKIYPCSQVFKPHSIMLKDPSF